MSLSHPNVSNPCKKFIEFKGDEGIFQYWDKNLKKNIRPELPIKFIVLDELSTIKGFSDAHQAGIYSNEVRSIKNQILNVRIFKAKTQIVGRYDDIKGRVKEEGGKFCKSVYAALINGEELELVNFQLTGAAFKSWCDKNVDTSKEGVVVSTTTNAKKGKVEYKIPNWNAFAVDAPLFDKAVEMDRALQEFLRIKLVEDKRAIEEGEPIESPESQKSESVQPDAEDDDIPF
jgi:hypothetical protein